MNLLTIKQQQIIAKEKKLLSNVFNLFSDIKVEKQDFELIKDTLIQLEEIFLVVVAGEYNSGKTAFINSLLGDSYLKSGITPTTDKITIIGYGESPDEIILEPGKLLKNFPIELLKEVRIVDTPGTNAILRQHESLTTDFIPRSDIIIFVTSVDRPYTESERGFLEKIREWGKKIIFVINKIDIVESQQDLEKVIEFVSKNSQKLFEETPEIFTLSAKQSLVDIQSGKKNDSFEKIKEYIFHTLDQDDRIKIKLNTPLLILENLISKYDEINQKNLNLIEQDVVLIADIHKQIALFREDSMRRFEFRYADIDNSILEFEKRGVNYFEDTFRIAKIIDLFNKERIQREYKDIVVKDMSVQVDNKVDDLIEWLVEENYKQWNIVNNKINDRMAVFKDRILNDPHTHEMQIERKKIITSVKREAQRVVEKFNRDAEAQKIAEEAQMSVAASAAIEIGALGLGTLVTILATTAAADLTGILLAGLTATLGFFIIPTRKKQVINLFREKITEIRKQLSLSLQDEITRQIDNVIENIQTTIAPYERFVKIEQSEINENNDLFKEIQKDIEQLKLEINNL
jgi:small GTP-binding protein